MISNGSKDVGYLIYYYMSIRISDIKPFLYFYRLKTLHDNSTVMIIGLLQKSHGDVIICEKNSQNYKTCRYTKMLQNRIFSEDVYLKKFFCCNALLNFC